MERLEDIKDLWEDKYIQAKMFYDKVDEGNFIDGYYDYEDKYGAVLYSVNSCGEIQRFYESEEEYLKCLPCEPSGAIYHKSDEKLVEFEIELEPERIYTIPKPIKTKKIKKK